MSDKVQSNTQKSSNRLIWLDIIRGLAIILVIYAHLLKNNTSLINSVLNSIRMPTFFFISGFFIYGVVYDFQLLLRRLKNRLTRQLYPTIILFSLFVVLFKNSNFEYAFDTYKAGYWFTYVSVLFFITLAPLLVLFTKIGLSNKGRIAVFLIIIVLSLVMQTLAFKLGFFETKIAGLLSFEHYIGYLRFLCAGCVFRIFWERYSDKLMNWTVYVLSIVCFILGFNFGGMLKILSIFFGIYVILFTAYKLSNIFTSSKILNFLSYLGSLTLEIYLLHYFVLNSTVYQWSWYSNFLTRVVNTPYELPIVLMLSLIIGLICLLIDKILIKINIKKYIFGKK